MNRVLPLLVFVSLSACRQAEECPSPVAASFNVRNAPLVAGAPATLELSATVPERCVAAFDELELTGEVIRPDGSSAQVTLDALERGRTATEYVLSADLTFDAPEAGAYEARLTIQPLDAAIAQKVTVALANATVRAHLATFPEGDCARILETSLGTVLCDNTVLRDGQAVQTLPGFLGIGGTAVWSYDDGVVRRYLDDGDGALTQDPPLGLDAAHAFPTAPGYFEAATETEWVLAHDGDVNRFRVSGNFLVEEAALLPFRDLSFDGLIRAGTRVVLHSTRQTSRKLCQLEAPPEGPLTLVGECEADDRETFFSEPDGTRAWRCALEAQGLTSCVLQTPRPEGLATLGELHLAFTNGFAFEPWRGYQSPALSRGFIPAFAGDTLHLEETVLPEGWSLFGLTPTRVVGQHRTLRQVGLFVR